MRTLVKTEIDQLSAGIAPILGAALIGGGLQAAFNVGMYLKTTDNPSFCGAAKTAARGFIEGAVLGSIGGRIARLLRW